MAKSEEVFISYSHDSVEHDKKVLDLSNHLRSEGVDCVLDQYEDSPPEGWPRWMDKQIRDAQHVVLVCTKNYYKRVMGDEREGIGLGIKWEGNLIYQHIYNAESLNKKFIPVIFSESMKEFIPILLQGATYYCLSTVKGYDGLYRRLTGQQKVLKPNLGKRKKLPQKSVNTNTLMFFTSPIDIELWDAAKWSSTFFAAVPGNPPVLGLGYKNEAFGRKIFQGWRERFGENDELEELRIAIIEGDIEGEETGYSVHIGPDIDAAISRFKCQGYKYNRDVLMSVSRINRMNPLPNSNHLEVFKNLYRKFKTYYLVPGVISEDGTSLTPIYELGIFKGKIFFRKVEDINEHDIDSVVLGTGGLDRPANDWTG
ncbi:MAG: TIR domain-containing protein [Candidatus Glassbacteria bacterium]|nr:TIR domain-containing protein [Candidatus Glassbacteria bacterium]